jgi:soluble lytic murein transglycosylase-like protein
MPAQRRIGSALGSLLGASALVVGGLVAPATAAEGVATAGSATLPTSAAPTASTTEVVSVEMQVTASRRNRLRHHYYYDPGPTAVRQMVRRIAVRWGVSPHLALAIAWQESAWQQNVRSSSGAIGIMQVMPATGRWVDGYLVHRDLDMRRSTDNVVAGVAFIDWLLDTARLYRRALAGYYQGLASVRRNNMFASTRAYVKSVQALRLRSRHGGILR